jgi:hypothetical protein
VQSTDVLGKNGKVIGTLVGPKSGRQSTQGDTVTGFRREEAQRGAAYLM